ncbi:MAG: D-tyrosyl-tRNA(Tyr) deacylase [Clostridia bacterium]|nr:D-tyrosyl-tRNA(Tyr) deacylase [Clostridia bacterium]MBR2296711.1 D-tyrosyl-tRNA(Tyr) deacylase [Clostridia bacterium]
MIAVIQRVLSASVTIDNCLHSKIDNGLLVLLGVKQGDTERDAELLAKKISNLRIFSDENDKMNLSVQDLKGEVLVVSNFTLLANYKKGNRPDYMNGAKPDEANRLYEYFCSCISQSVPTKTGVFGADMKLGLVNDGPVTIVMDSEVLK